MTTFNELYSNLNPAQKAAVDSIDGPVMVVAGPGTGKTQVLSLRIANILNATDTPPDGILCLTFTNSGASAMRERLRKYIGATASQVVISTFHSFGMKMVEEFYTTLGYVEKPVLIDDAQGIALADAILENNEWQHIRSRANKALYFRDIKSLISVLKRQRLTPELFLTEIRADIARITDDPANISTRGESKGKLKQEAVKKIESLQRTEEIVRFYELYEAAKKDQGLLDYDDVLEELVRLVEMSEDAVATIRERYLYVLVDEHQDSSGVQNEFLSKVWADVERPNIFVVGDDRQLIYGFGGASLSYFEGFKDMFPGVQLITLTDNYRSTQTILDAAETLLKSSLADAPLVSQSKEAHPLMLVEAEYPRDEIIRAGLFFKEKMKDGVDPNHCALLVPKNIQVRNAARILRDMGLSVSSPDALTLFELPETQSFLAVLEALADPMTPSRVAPLLLDSLANIPPLTAHAFLSSHNSRTLSLDTLLNEKETLALFPEDNAVLVFARRLSAWLTASKEMDVYGLIQHIGDELLLQPAASHDTLTRRAEIVRSFLHLVLSKTEKNPRLTLSEFLEFIRRMESYGADIPLAVFAKDEGIKVMTLHGSKGLEFDAVWIAHMDERGVMGGKKQSFALPESVEAKIEEKDELTVRRQIYVAITRAKRFCTLSFSLQNYTGGSQELAHVVADLPEHLFTRISATETEQVILKGGVHQFVRNDAVQEPSLTKRALAELVAKEYAKRKLAVTHLNNFFECPWKWYFRNLISLPEPESISLQFGNVVHGCIEDILKDTKKPTAKILDGYIAYRMEKIRGLEPVEEKRMTKEARALLDVFVESRLPAIAKERQSEKPLSYHDPEFSHLLITGKIDLVETLELGRVRVTDFKTGSVKKKSEIEKETEDGHMSNYLRQLAMYSYLLDRTTKGDVAVVESQLEFLEAQKMNERMYSTVVSPSMVEALRKDIMEFDSFLASGSWVDRECQFKAWKAGEECEYCRLAKIYD